MDAESYTDLVPLIFIAVVFFTVAVGALYWSSKRGQLRDLINKLERYLLMKNPREKCQIHFQKKMRGQKLSYETTNFSWVTIKNL